MICNLMCFQYNRMILFLMLWSKVANGMIILSLNIWCTASYMFLFIALLVHTYYSYFLSTQGHLEK